MSIKHAHVPCPGMGQEYGSHARTTRSRPATTGARGWPQAGSEAAAVPWATLPCHGATSGSVPPYTRWPRWRVGTWGRAWGPPKLRPCCQVALCSPANPVEIAVGKLLSLTARLPAPSRPGTIPKPRVSPAGRGGGSCAAVCSALLLLVARAIIKGLVGPDLLQGFDTFLPIFGVGSGCLCVRHNSSSPMGN